MCLANRLSCLHTDQNSTEAFLQQVICEIDSMQRVQLPTSTFLPCNYDVTSSQMNSTVIRTIESDSDRV